MLSRSAKRERIHPRRSALLGRPLDVRAFALTAPSCHIYGQFIDDRAGKTLVSASSKDGKTGIAQGRETSLQPKVVGKAVVRTNSPKLPESKRSCFDRGVNTSITAA